MTTTQELLFTPRAGISELIAYSVPKHSAATDLKLDSNEGAVPPTSLLEILQNDMPNNLRLYPEAKVLETIIAKRLGVSPQQVILTAGADEALDRLCRISLSHNREIIIPEPTFEMIHRYAKLADGNIVSVSWGRDSYPTNDIISAITPETALIAVVSPNNPTGQVASPEDLIKISKAAPHALIIADLAYDEFADSSLTETALSLPNVIAVRSLSKAWGLAGLRVGFAVGSEEIIKWMRAAAGPYSVSQPSIALSIASLEQNESEMNDFVRKVRDNRTTLERLLNELGAEPLPSQANFILAKFPNAHWTRDALAGLGIAVRIFPNHPQLVGYLRITIPANVCDFARLIEAIKSILAPEALLLDMDGVIADVSKSYRKAIIETAASFGVTLSHETVSNAKAKPGANNDWIVTQHLLAEAGVDVSLKEVTIKFEECYQGTSVEPGLRKHEIIIPKEPLLNNLSSRLPIAIVTGRPRQDAERFLEENEITHYISALVCMEDSPSKPSPEGVNKAMELLNVSRAWMVGDSPDDILAARAARVVPIGVLAPGAKVSTARDALNLAGAARIIDSITELENLLP